MGGWWVAWRVGHDLISLLGSRAWGPDEVWSRGGKESMGDVPACGGVGWRRGVTRPIARGRRAGSPRGLRSDGAVLDYVDTGWDRSPASSASVVVEVEMQCSS